jgi:predicted dehydrogenase/threonine dehydrogenase-like Zn-dependent dehydrogenase
MKQVLQSLRTGVIEVVDVPAPELISDHLLISTSRSLVSSGTERMLVDFGKASLFTKIRQQPEKVKKVLEKARTDGFFQTFDAVRSKLDQPLALGYCNVGVVMNGTTEGITVGDRVASNGNHAEVVRVSKNICVKLPDSVDDDTASFTALAAIGLQGVRLAQPTIGEAFVVQGLGLIGLLTAQILRINGCSVLGIDVNSSRCELARQYCTSVVDLSEGDPIAAATEFSRGRGVDAVLICTSTTSNDVVSQAAEMCRKRGRIVLIGTAGLSFRREDFYKKEISFQVSASFGPGRYDPAYEEHGHDYPIGFVRWTQQRNFEAVISMMAAGSLDVKSMITHRLSINEAATAYELLDNSNALGIVIAYPNNDRRANRVITLREHFDYATSNYNTGNEGKLEGSKTKRATEFTPIIGFIGAGNYASRVLIPAFKRLRVGFDTLASNTGVSCVYHGRKEGFLRCTTDLNTIWNSSSINTVVIATRHNVHAQQVIAALKAGKHVFVEKPLCLTLNELNEIRTLCGQRGEQVDTNANATDKSQRCFSKNNSESLSNTCGPSRKPILRVGFNRRFSPHINKIKQLLATVAAPKSFVMTVNAGEIPAEHWTQDKHIGGGRIIGEACHFIALLRYLADAPITEFDRSSMTSALSDTVTIVLKFANGSIGTVHYFANGSKSFPKERLDVFTNGRVLSLDNYCKLTGYGWSNFRTMNLWRQDKGQLACVKAFVEEICISEEKKSYQSPIELEELFEVTEVTIKLAS